MRRSQSPDLIANSFNRHKFNKTSYEFFKGPHDNSKLANQAGGPKYVINQFGFPQQIINYKGTKYGGRLNEGTPYGYAGNVAKYPYQKDLWNRAGRHPKINNLH